ARFVDEEEGIGAVAEVDAPMLGVAHQVKEEERVTGAVKNLGNLDVTLQPGHAFGTLRQAAFGATPARLNAAVDAVVFLLIVRPGAAGGGADEYLGHAGRRHRVLHIAIGMW